VQVLQAVIILFVAVEIIFRRGVVRLRRILPARSEGVPYNDGSGRSAI